MYLKKKKIAFRVFAFRKTRKPEKSDTKTTQPGRRIKKI